MGGLKSHVCLQASHIADLHADTIEGRASRSSWEAQGWVGRAVSRCGWADRRAVSDGGGYWCRNTAGRCQKGYNCTQICSYLHGQVRVQYSLLPYEFYRLPQKALSVTLKENDYIFYHSQHDSSLSLWLMSPSYGKSTRNKCLALKSWSLYAFSCIYSSWETGTLHGRYIVYMHQVHSAWDICLDGHSLRTFPVSAERKRFLSFHKT